MKTKEYDLTMNVGEAKYLLAFCSGEKKHKDGSLQCDVMLFRSKKALDKQIRTLKDEGYLPVCR